MLIAGLDANSLLSGAVPALAIVIVSAVVKVLSNRRKAEEKRNAAKGDEDRSMEQTVREMMEFLGGTKKTAFKAAQPGFVERFDTLEAKVDGHGEVLVSLQDGIGKLLEGQEKAADAVVKLAHPEGGTP